ncbi:galactokinase [candidate division KSB1 bacterium]
MINIADLSKNTIEIKRWLELLENRPSSFFQYIEQYYLSDEDIFNAEKELFLKALEYSEEIYGRNEKVAILRIPGRVNLLGMHIDHRMGSVNPIAIHNLIMVIQPRNDDKIFIYNCNPSFKPSSFSINEQLPDKKIIDWDDWTKKQLELRIQQKKSGDWVNYFQAAALYLQNYVKSANHFFRLSGFNAVINSSIPYAVGLSSSSSLVVGAALTLMAINNIQFTDQEFIDFCGTAEWYIGTRGGKGDHAAMYIGKKGNISHISFNPFSVSYAPFPKDYCIVLCNSMVVANKITGARSKFNAGVANYEIGFQLLKNFFPDLSHKMEYLRDVTPERSNLPDSKIYSIIKSLPERITRNELINQFPESIEFWEKVFSTHDKPQQGYLVRDACLYGISECIRSEKAAEFLKNGDVLKFGELMNISHDGDRVTQKTCEKRVPYRFRATDELIDSLIKKVSLERDNEPYKLYRQSGWYAMSCPETDELVDISLETDGVVGARLVGAGMGGYVSVLVDKNKLKKLIARVEKIYYKPRNLTPAAEICFPVEGADFIKFEL